MARPRHHPSHRGVRHGAAGSRGGGRLADRVALGLGADVARLRWAIEVARTARAEAGLDAGTLSFSAIVPTGVAHDSTRPPVGRQHGRLGGPVRGDQRPVVGPVTEAQRPVYEAIGATYDMNQHGGLGDQVAALTDDFVDAYAIVGTPSRCAERVLELAALGIGAMMLAPPQGDASDDDIRDGYRMLVDEVLPACAPAASGLTMVARHRGSGFRLLSGRAERVSATRIGLRRDAVPVPAPCKGTMPSVSDPSAGEAGSRSSRRRGAARGRPAGPRRGRRGRRGGRRRRLRPDRRPHPRGRRRPSLQGGNTRRRADLHAIVATASEVGRLDILANVAGVASDGLIAEVTRTRSTA